MNSDDLSALTQEIEFLKDSRQHAECIRRMDQYDKETTDPIVRALLLTAKATCALQVGNLAIADNAVSLIDNLSLPAEMGDYVNLTRATVAHESGRLDEADRLLSLLLASETIYDDGQREVLYEAFARKGFVQADRNQFDAALDLLRRATAIFDQGELSDNIGLYQGYCFQGLSRLDEARECLMKILRFGTGNLDADAYYRLGAVEIEDGDLTAAIADFQNALSSLPRGRIARSSILEALSEAERQATGLKRINKTSTPAKPSIQ